jgi:DNA-binding phage protein
MSKRPFRSVRRAFTAEEKARFVSAREQAEQDRPRLAREALAKKAELVALHDAMMALKREREARGLSLADVAERSGIDKSRLSKLESDPRSNPTLATLTRIADAIGVRLEIHVASS